MTTASPFAPSGGDGFASFLLGFGSGGGLTMNSFIAGQMIYRAYYAGDQFHITPRLTLNYGLAWNYETNALNHDLTKPKFLAPIFGPGGLGHEAICPRTGAASIPR